MESAGLVPCADDERDISWATKEKKMLNERKIKKKDGEESVRWAMIGLLSEFCPMDEGPFIMKPNDAL